jgi:hypothetical protein
MASLFQDPWAVATICPCPLLGYLNAPEDESRPVSKAKKAEIKETGLLFSSPHA